MVAVGKFLVWVEDDRNAWHVNKPLKLVQGKDPLFSEEVIPTAPVDVEHHELTPKV